MSSYPLVRTLVNRSHRRETPIEKGYLYVEYITRFETFHIAWPLIFILRVTTLKANWAISDIPLTPYFNSLYWKSKQKNISWSFTFVIWDLGFSYSNVLTPYFTLFLIAILVYKCLVLKYFPKLDLNITQKVSVKLLTFQSRLEIHTS